MPWAPELVNSTGSPSTGWPALSVTVAVAVVVSAPSAVSVAGSRSIAMCAGRPATWRRSAVSESDPSAAVMVECPRVWDDVMRAE